MDIKYSIVIPIFNEEECVQPLYKMIKEVMDKIGNYEIIYVDDGSSDKTFNILKELHKIDKNLKVIKFIHNFGQTQAMAAGFDYSKGDIIITMDADLQNDPKDIPILLEKMNEGYDVVSGWRFDRKDKLEKRLPSKFSNLLVRYLTKVKIHDSGCSLKAYSKKSINSIKLFGEMHRYIPSLIAINGFKIGEVKVRHHKREKGVTKYGLSRLVKGPLDLFYIVIRVKHFGFLQIDSEKYKIEKILE